MSGIALSVAEIKLLFALCYFAIFGAATIVYFQRALQDQPNFFNAVEKYMVCNYCDSIGQSTETCHKDYTQYTHTPERAVSYVIMSLIPTALLIFLINWKRVIHYVASFKAKICSKNKTEIKGQTEYPQVSIHSALSPIPESSNTYRENY